MIVSSQKVLKLQNIEIMHKMFEKHPNFSSDVKTHTQKIAKDFFGLLSNESHMPWKLSVYQQTKGSPWQTSIHLAATVRLSFVLVGDGLIDPVSTSRLF